MKLSLVSGHPRLFITPDKIAEFRKRSNGFNKALRDQLLEALEPVVKSAITVREQADTCGPEFLGMAIAEAWQLTKDKKYGMAAFWLMGSYEALAITCGGHYDYWGTAAESAAVLYDWCYDWFKAEGLLDVAATVTQWTGSHALNLSLRYYILEDWHNYQLGLQAGALAAGLALGYDHPKLEDGSLLRTLHAAHFTGLKGAANFVQDAYSMPATTRCLETALRSSNGTGFAAHLESTGGYHGVDGNEISKIAELWTHALRPSARGKKPIWPEAALMGHAYTHFLRPDGFCIASGDAWPQKPNKWPAMAVLRLNARGFDPCLASYVEKYWQASNAPYPTSALLYLHPPAKKSPPRPPLPTSAMFDPLVVMRSSWDADATMISFRCGKFSGNHNNLDHNSFSIYRGGALAIDSGSVDYASSNRPEYSTRTVAHNAILVRNPDEVHWLGKHGKPTVNDGGQRLVNVAYTPPNKISGEPHGIITEERRTSFADEFDMGEIVAFEAGDKFDYVAGDATRAYTYPWSGIGTNPSRRVEEAVRQLVFLKPDIVVIFDRVEATKKHFEKKWLLHTIGAPTAIVGGERRTAADGISELPPGAFEYSQERGRMTVWPLLPAKHAVRAVGGKDHEYWVDHAPGRDGKGMNHPLAKPYPESGAWRIEVIPSEPSLRDCFLTVIHAGMQSDAPAAATLRCGTTSDKKSVTVTIEKAEGEGWSPVATIAFGTNGAITLACAYAGEQRKFRSRAPARVPAAKARRR
jgi:hypothetical protein